MSERQNKIYEEYIKEQCRKVSNANEAGDSFAIKEMANVKLPGMVLHGITIIILTVVSTFPIPRQVVVSPAVVWGEGGGEVGERISGQQ